MADVYCIWIDMEDVCLVTFCEMQMLVIVMGGAQAGDTFHYRNMDIDIRNKRQYKVERGYDYDVGEVTAT